LDAFLKPVASVLLKTAAQCSVTNSQLSFRGCFDLFHASLCDSA
jgi:hypothetical protein